LLVERDGAEEMRFGVFVVTKLDRAQSYGAVQRRQDGKIDCSVGVQQGHVGSASFTVLSETLEEHAFGERGEYETFIVLDLGEDALAVGDDLPRLVETLELLQRDGDAQMNDRHVVRKYIVRGKLVFRDSEGIERFLQTTKGARDCTMAVWSYLFC
jgi:hypothetical protein